MFSPRYFNYLYLLAGTAALNFLFEDRPGIHLYGCVKKSLKENDIRLETFGEIQQGTVEIRRWVAGGYSIGIFQSGAKAAGLGGSCFFQPASINEVEWSRCIGNNAIGGMQGVQAGDHISSLRMTA